MLVTAFMLVCIVMSATEVTWQASGNSTLPTAIGEDITLAWTNASFSSSKPTAAYLSANGTLTVTAPEGMTVQSVTFKFSGENLSLTADPQGNYATDSWNNTGTWSGSANAVTFTAPGKRYITKITVTYIAESSVPTTPVLSITQITNFDDTYDLDNDTKTLVVYYKNEGTDAQNAKLTLFVNNVENNVVNLNTIANGANTWVNLPYNKETIAAGAQTVKVSLTADGVDAIEESKTVTFTKAAPEATFSVAAANVNVAHDATSYQVVATVTNTSNVDATGVQVLLQKSLQNVAEPQAIDLAALASKDVTFTAEKGAEHHGGSHYVHFSWDDTDVSFAEILDAVGELPIPPYLNRKTEESDKRTYQTVYSKIKGSVAAPTAGLHFTEKVLKALDDAGITREELTLHVGAGTFKPVKSDEIEGHEMHSEYIVVKRQTISRLLEHEGQAIAVGTTSVRTLESLYYIGVKLQDNPDLSEDELHIEQWMPYEYASKGPEISVMQSLRNIDAYMERNGLKALHTSTQIIIAPGYEYKIVKIMVTNFHQPQSTLLLLVSAFVHGDWRKIYDYALAHDFRFLSYGDSSLLIP